MSRDVTTLRKRNQVFHMAEVIRESDYNSFPVVDHLYKVVGTISRHNLMAILKKCDILDDEKPKSLAIQSTGQRSSLSQAIATTTGITRTINSSRSRGSSNEETSFE